MSASRSQPPDPPWVEDPRDAELSIDDSRPFPLWEPLEPDHDLISMRTTRPLGRDMTDGEPALPRSLGVRLAIAFAITLLALVACTVGLASFTLVGALVGRQVEKIWLMALCGLATLLVPFLLFLWLRRRFFHPRLWTVLLVTNTLCVGCLVGFAPTTTRQALEARGAWWVSAIARVAHAEESDVVQLGKGLVLQLAHAVPRSQPSPPSSPPSASRSAPSATPKATATSPQSRPSATAASRPSASPQSQPSPAAASKAPASPQSQPSAVAAPKGAAKKDVSPDEKSAATDKLAAIRHLVTVGVSGLKLRRSGRRGRKRLLRATVEIHNRARRTLRRVRVALRLADGRVIRSRAMRLRRGARKSVTLTAHIRPPLGGLEVRLDSAR